ncbi:MAG: cysteine synthase A [Planctomycetota bacterium]
MKEIINSVLDCIGQTPMIPINLCRLDKTCLRPDGHRGRQTCRMGRSQPKSIARIMAKLEFINPSGSVKDRIAKHIIEKAERRGDLKKDSIIVEASSGNTGIGLAMVAAAKGYRLIIIMPEHMSKERVKIMRALGAKVILTPKSGGFTRPVQKAEAMAKRNPKIFLPRQFSNPDNTEVHRLTTGREIIRQCHGKIDAFVAGIGTGGTLMGVAEALREKGIKAKIVAVEPSEAAILSGEVEMCSHHIAGIGDGFIPEIVNEHKIDQVVKVNSLDAVKMAKRMITRLGLMVGVSSGANYWAACQVARQLGQGKTVVTVLPDRMERYFSTALFK